MTLATWVSIAAVIAAFANIGSLLAVVLQLRGLTAQTHEAARQAEASVAATRTAVHLKVMQEMVDIDRFFCDRPDLRALFYGAPKVPGHGMPEHRVEAAAEMIVDMIEGIALLQEHFDGDLGVGWRLYFKELFDNSDALRAYWSSHRVWYQGAMQELLDPLLEGHVR